MTLRDNVVKARACMKDGRIYDGIAVLDTVLNEMQSMPVELKPVKTLDTWFANLPLIYKLDLYKSYTGVITKHLEERR